MVKNIRKIFWILQIAKQKKRALFEAQMDGLFMETVKGRFLRLNDDEERKELASIVQKEERTEEDEKRIVQLENDINEAKAVKNLYARNTVLRADLVQYIDLIKQCLKDGNF